MTHTATVEVNVSIFLALIALVSSVCVASISARAIAGKQDKNDAVAMEHRMTDIENAITYKLNPLWTAIEREIPKLLLKKDTIELDNLLNKMHDGGLDYFSPEELRRLSCLLDDEYQKASQEEDDGKRGRAFVLVLVRGVVNGKIHEREHRIPTKMEEL